MLYDPFPACIEPRKFCIRNGSLHSVIPLEKLRRLSEYLHDDHGQAEVMLSFDRDEAGSCIVTGTVKAVVNLQCQRCLEATTVELSSDLAIRLADSDKQARALAENLADSIEQLEIIVCDNGQLDLLALVEDELILSLPIVVTHEDDNCSEQLNALHEQADNLDRESGRSAIQGLDALAKLKETLKKERSE